MRLNFINDSLLEFEPEEIGLTLLNHFNTDGEERWSLHNFMMQAVSHLGKNSKQKVIIESLIEGWTWLEREGLLIPSFSFGRVERDWVSVSPRGRKLLRNSNLKEYLASSYLPIASLDPTLAEKVRPLFIRGDYDIAVFQAFKEIEIRVRKSGDYPDTLVGVVLMNQAFSPENGKLNIFQVKSEKIACHNLFSGAIGLFKNPTSHRDVPIKVLEASDLIHFANYLLRLVDKASEKTLSDI